MRQKKVRGHRRRWKEIENWRLANLGLNLTDYLIYEGSRYHTKINVHPWSGLTLTNSKEEEPRRRTKRKIINGLLDIYEDWKKQLDELGCPYYLKVWLFEPCLSKSEVVCSIGSSIDFYKSTFYSPVYKKDIQLDSYGEIKSKLSKLNWDYFWDEDQYGNAEVGEREMYRSKEDYDETKKRFANLLKRPHRTEVLTEPIGDTVEIYSFKRGHVWLGERKL